MEANTTNIGLLNLKQGMIKNMQSQQSLLLEINSSTKKLKDAINEVILEVRAFNDDLNRVNYSKRDSTENKSMICVNNTSECIFLP